jgi:hypothetical protein
MNLFQKNPNFKEIDSASGKQILSTVVSNMYQTTFFLLLFNYFFFFIVIHFLCQNFIIIFIIGLVIIFIINFISDICLHRLVLIFMGFTYCACMSVIISLILLRFLKMVTFHFVPGVY